MKASKQVKDFDCVQMKNEIQAKIYAETKDMSFEELRAYLDQRLKNDAFWQRIKEEEFYGKTITVKVKYANFRVITRSRTFPCKVTHFRFLWSAAKEILSQVDLSQQKVRLLGLGVSNASDEPEKKYEQLALNLF
jgi:nucleotidyltransferase/DNA polymerase involved in DNA repair